MRDQGERGDQILKKLKNFTFLESREGGKEPHIFILNIGKHVEMFYFIFHQNPNTTQEFDCSEREGGMHPYFKISISIIIVIQM